MVKCNTGLMPVDFTFLFAIGSVVNAEMKASDKAQYSKLWGEKGELWEQQKGRLKDFTNVGYKKGDVPIPDWPVGVKVTDFGAVPNDKNDDSKAFIDAIDACPDNHAVLVPRGRYIITQQIKPQRDHFVLRGEDMYESPRSLELKIKEAIANACD